MADFGVRWGRKRLLPVGIHGGVLVESTVEALLVANCVGPLLVGVFWDGGGEDVVGEGFAGGGSAVGWGEGDEVGG